MKKALPVLECCPPPGASLDAPAAERLSQAFSLLADPARVQLMSLIAGAGEACVCELTEPLGLTQPTVSHHLKLLSEAGLLEREQRGRWAYFRVKGEPLRELASVLTTSFEPAAP